VNGRVQAYGDPGLDQLYNLMFADDADAFRASAEGRLAVLFDRPADLRALARLADDRTVESRLRVIAYRRLYESTGSKRPADLPLLGVVVEVAVDGGLDTLAAYSDRRLRYINHAGGVTVVEDGSPLAAEIDTLFRAAAELAPALTDRTAPRTAQPTGGQARLTLLKGDRRRQLDGDLAALDQDPKAGPVLSAALALLGRIVSFGGAG
jgi:hypothetical protein